MLFIWRKLKKSQTSLNNFARGQHWFICEKNSMSLMYEWFSSHHLNAGWTVLSCELQLVPVFTHSKYGQTHARHSRSWFVSPDQDMRKVPAPQAKKQVNWYREAVGDGIQTWRGEMNVHQVLCPYIQNNVSPTLKYRALVRVVQLNNCNF